MFRKIFFLFSFSIVWLNGSLAQNNYAVKYFTTSDGLPHNQVQSITQDSTGFLWVATWDGLSRFDGYEFTNYYHNPDDSTSIPYFSVADVLVDHYNQVWAGTYIQNAVYYNRAKDNFEGIRINEKNHSLRKITVDQNGYFWQFDPQSGLRKFDYSKKELASIKAIDINGKEITFDKAPAYSISFDNLGHIWLFAHIYETVNIYYGSIINQQTVSFRTLSMPSPYLIDPGSPGIFTDLIINPYISDTGRIYLFSNWGIFLVDETSGIISRITGDVPLSEFKGKFPFIWSPDNLVIYHYNTQTGILDSIKDNTGNHVLNYYLDQKGNVWISKIKKSGEGDGLIEAIPVQSFFKHYLYGKGKNPNAYCAILKDHRGNIWVAAKNINCIFRIDPEGKIKKLNILDKKIWKESWNPRYFMEDSAGIWIGYYRHLLKYYDHSTEKFSDKFFEKGNVHTNLIKSGFRDLIKKDNTLIANCDTRLIAFDARTMEYIKSFKPTGEVENYAIYCLKEDGEKFYIGMSNGEVRSYDFKLHELNKWKIGNGLFIVLDICLGDHNDIWAALLGGGLAHLNLESGRSEIFTTADGLSNNTCYSILKDRKGNLWISTNHGINRFNPRTKQFFVFGPTDGLKIDEFNSDAAYQTPDGEMFFGGMGGIVGFYPDSLQEQNNIHNPARLMITGFKISGFDRTFQDAVYNMDTVRLNKGDDNFQVNFTCLDFRDAEKIKYRYRLYPEKKNWTETDYRHRFVNYSNLTSGSYRLDIEATNRDGEWISHKILIIIIPPFIYQTVWFKILAVIGFLLIMHFLGYNYIRQIRVSARQQQERLRLESLRGQMNPHFVFNSLNSINYFISKNDQLSANRYIADFSRLIRSVLSNLSNEYITFTKELESIRDYLQLEYLRFGDRFDYSIKIPENPEFSDFQVFPGMVQPFIENAIWHGVRGLSKRKGNIRVEFTFSPTQQLQCTIEDDGIGRILSEKMKSNLPGKTSRGIAIILERLQIFNDLRKTNYQVIIEDIFCDREETGTRVILDIPTKKQ